MDLEEYLRLQDSEIERHKWIESEKAGKDLGIEAVIDWILKYADQFSDHYLRLRSGVRIQPSPTHERERSEHVPLRGQPHESIVS